MEKILIPCGALLVFQSKGGHFELWLPTNPVFSLPELVHCKGQILFFFFSNRRGQYTNIIDKPHLWQTNTLYEEERGGYRKILKTGSCKKINTLQTLEQVPRSTKNVILLLSTNIYGDVWTLDLRIWILTVCVSFITCGSMPASIQQQIARFLKKMSLSTKTDFWLVLDISKCH